MYNSNDVAFAEALNQALAKYRDRPDAIGDLGLWGMRSLSDTPREKPMKPARPPQGDKGSPWFRELYKAFAPVREEALQYSDQEINSAIDEAVVAVRKRR